MKTVLLRAPLLSQSGYGVHSRQIARWLFSVPDLDVSCELLNWGQTPWLTNSSEDGLVKEILQASTNQKQFYDITIQNQLPNEWNPFLGLYNVGVTAGVETDRCNPAWIDAVNRMQLVIVPSEHTKQTFLNTGKVKTPIVVVPESFPDSFLTGDECVELPELDALKTKFNFLVVGTMTGNNPENERKNIAYTMKWVAEQFKDNEDVGLIVKSSLGRNTHLDRLMLQNIQTQMISQFGLTSGFPKFYLLHGEMTDLEMKSLYRHPKVKALLNLSRGEGFCLPALEAASQGLPVIATGWSAHTEFLGLGKYIKVDYKLQEIHPSRVDNQIFMQGTSWAYPDEQDVKKRLRKFYENPSIPREWAQDLQKTIRERFSFSAIAKKYSEVLSDKLR